MKVLLYFDGSCENNGSDHAVGGFGWIAIDKNAEITASGEWPSIGEGYGIIRGDADGKVTNNVAEWQALIEAVKWLSCYKAESIEVVEVRGDSKLVIEQAKGDWKCKTPHLKAFRDCLWELMDTRLKGVPVVYEWIPREQNADADRLSTKAFAS